jgi:large conductance mechanosensitive channel
MKGFIEFIRTQGVIGLAVGFILGGAVSKLVTAVVNDIVNPIIGLALGSLGGLRGAYLRIGTARILWGDLVNTFIDFVIIAGVVYFIVKGLGFDKLDKPKA